MIRMSKETDYGIILLAHLANDREELSHSAREVAHETQLPLPMVSKILKTLAREGLLISQRGVKGGYALARKPDRISVAEIVSAMEGPIAMTECIEAPGECRHEPLCRLRLTWHKINDAVLLALKGISLVDLAGPGPSHFPWLAGSPVELIRLQ